MDTDQKFWLLVWAILGASICTLALIIATAINYNYKLGIENGLVEVQNVGTTGTHWERIK